MDFQTLMMNGAEALENGKLEEAEKLFLLAAEKEGAVYLAYYNLGVLATDQEQPDKALAYLEKALSLKNDDIDILTALGTVHLKEARDFQAEACFQKALALGGNEVVYNNLGIIAFRKKDYQKAKKLYQQALKVNPDYQEARENIALANFYLAMLT